MTKVSGPNLVTYLNQNIFNILHKRHEPVSTYDYKGVCYP